MYQSNIDNRIQNAVFLNANFHFNKLSKLHCEQFDITVCEEWSGKHSNHVLLDISTYLENKNETLQADIEELEENIYPLYQEIASSFLVQRADLQKNTMKLISAVDERGKDWHRKIDSIIKKITPDIKETESIHLDFLKEQEDEISHNISEITQRTVELKGLLVSNDSGLFF